MVTGVGGGSVRDLLIGAPVFWVQDGAIAAVCIAIALIVWATPERWWQRGQLLEWADAVGLAAYAVFGTAKALAWGVPPVPALMMGVITGCVGGTIRDILAGVPSIIMRPEIYVTAAALSSGLYLVLLWLGLGSPLQEDFAVCNRHRLKGVGWIRTCGGMLDYYSGRTRRAPAWMQQAGLEWLYRAKLEPRRLGTRYARSNLPALYHILTKTGRRQAIARAG